MEEKPLVSVITPAYNAGVFIEDAIKNVLNQTYQNFEHIIIDDGSTDNTAQIVHSFSDPRIKYILEKNSGQSFARNTGIEVARGKYVAFLDADDLFFPNKLSKQVSHMEARPDCDFCYCKIYHFFHNEPSKLYHLEMDHPSGYIFDKLLATNFINPLSAMVRKDVFKKHGAFGPYRWADEQYLWLKLSYQNVKFCYIDKALGSCRLNPRSFTNRPQYFHKSQKECLEIIKVIKNWMTESEREKYEINKFEKKIRRNIFIGKLMAGSNIFARFLHFLYLQNRRRRLKIIEKKITD